MTCKKLVDIRVLQMIYIFDRQPAFPLYVGQQVDVFIEQLAGNAQSIKNDVQSVLSDRTLHAE